jgi:beta-lactamase class A
MNPRAIRRTSTTARAVRVALVLALLATSAAVTAPLAAPAPTLDRALLARRIAAIARDARPARLGVAVLVPETGTRWSLAGRERFPMQSVFKAPLGAMVLDAADHRRLRLDSTLVITAADLSIHYSAVSDSFPARTRYTVVELMELAVGTSDNTAADVLLRLVGGPRALTLWLRAHGLGGVRVDRFERDQQPAIKGMGPFRSEWSNDEAFTRAANAVPEPARRAAVRRYLEGSLDTITPESAVAFLAALDAGRLLSPPSSARLLRIMSESQTGAGRLRAGLPVGTTLAHKTGTGPTVLGQNTACNDIGMVTLADGRKVAIAVLLSGSTADDGARDAVVAAVARAVVEAVESTAARSPTPRRPGARRASRGCGRGARRWRTASAGMPRAGSIAPGEEWRGPCSPTCRAAAPSGAPRARDRRAWSGSSRA